MSLPVVVAATPGFYLANRFATKLHALTTWALPLRLSVERATAGIRQAVYLRQPLNLQAGNVFESNFRPIMPGVPSVRL